MQWLPLECGVRGGEEGDGEKGRDKLSRRGQMGPVEPACHAKGRSLESQGAGDLKLG